MHPSGEAIRLVTGNPFRVDQETPLLSSDKTDCNTLATAYCRTNKKALLRHGTAPKKSEPTVEAEG